MPNENQFTEQIDGAKAATQRAKDALLKTFDAVPEEKLNWSPSPSARTPVWIAAHCGAANEFFAAVLRGEPSGLPSDLKEATAFIRAGGQNVTTRAEAVEMIGQSTEKILNALDAITPTLLQSTPQSPFGPIPFAVWMQVPADHMMGHKSQLDYLQTIWGDLEGHS